MIIRRYMFTLALAACTLAPLSSHALSILGRNNNDTASAVPKGKMIKLTLRNKSTAEMTLLVNDKAIILPANGGEYKLAAVEGTDIYDAAHTTVQLHVSREMNGNTVSFR